VKKIIMPRKNTLLSILAAAVVLVVGFYALNSYIYQQKQGGESAQENANLGAYDYRCDDNTRFSMTVLNDGNTISIAPSTGTEQHATSLTNVPSESGVRFEGGGYVFLAHGETVELHSGSYSTVCHPEPDPDNAPYNFGD
jgi:membrane-bound inhibitor of C-type lysozyme